MKVCFVSHSAAKLGAERSLLEFIDALGDQGVTCFAILPHDGPLCGDLKRRGVELAIVPFTQWVGLPSGVRPQDYEGISFRHLDGALALADKAASWGCDVVCTNTLTICAGALAARLLGVPHVWCVQEFSSGHYRWEFEPGEARALWMVEHFSAACVPNSHALARQFQGRCAPAKLKVVYPAVEVPALDASQPLRFPRSKDALRCVVVGSLQQGKRQDEAIRAVAALVDRGIEAELTLVGPCNDFGFGKHLKELVQRLGLRERVKWIGYIESPFDYLKGADIVLNCSYFEAFGRTTVEAMKLAKPVIGANSGGTAELIQAGVTGLLYAPGDPEDLAQKILCLWQQPDLARSMAENARRFALQRFNRSRLGRELLDVLQSCASAPPDPVADRFLMGFLAGRLRTRGTAFNRLARSRWISRLHYSLLGRGWSLLAREGWRPLLSKAYHRFFRRGRM